MNSDVRCFPECLLMCAFVTMRMCVCVRAG